MLLKLIDTNEILLLITLRYALYDIYLASKYDYHHENIPVLFNFYPLLKSHFFLIIKLGFTRVYIIFLYLLKNIDCGYSLEPPP